MRLFRKRTTTFMGGQRPDLDAASRYSTKYPAGFHYMVGFYRALSPAITTRHRSVAPPLATQSADLLDSDPRPGHCQRCADYLPPGYTGRLPAAWRNGLDG